METGLKLIRIGILIILVALIFLIILAKVF